MKRGSRFLKIIFVSLMVMLAGGALMEVEGASPIDSLSDNSWAYLNPQLSKRYQAFFKDPARTDAQTPADMIETREPAFREYSYPVYGDGKIIYFGGAHGGYAGNDVEVYDIANNIWSQSYKPNVPFPDDPVYGSGGSERSWVDPATGEVRPYTIHGYGRQTYHPRIQKYVVTASYCVNVVRDPVSGQYSCAQNSFSLVGYDAATKKWSLLKNNVPDHADLSQYDSQLGGLLFFQETGDGLTTDVYLYKDGTLTQRRRMNGRLARSGGAASVYIPEQKIHLIAAMGHNDGSPGFLYKYDSINETSVDLTSSMPPELQTALQANFAMTYDSNNKKVIAMIVESGYPRTWIYDVLANTWQKLPISTTALSIRNFDPAEGRAPLQYDPTNNVAFLVMRDANSALKTFAYRYSASGVISDSTAPSVPLGLTATAISSSQINLAWTASTDNVGVTGYKIYRCTGSTCTPATQIATSSSNSYQDKGLSADTTYRYTISAYDAAGNVSGQSTSVGATTQAGSSGQINIPLKTWVARQLPPVGEATCGYGADCKHSHLAQNENNKRIYFGYGDFSGPFSTSQSARNELFSYSVVENNWVLEYPYCGPQGEVQPFRPDETGFVWDSKRQKFWIVPGGGAFWDDPCPAPSSQKIRDIMTFDPVTKKYQHPVGTWHGYDATYYAVYDPVKDAIFMFDHHGGMGTLVLEYTIATDTWRTIQTSLATDGTYINNAHINVNMPTIDVEGRYIYVISKYTLDGVLLRYNIDQGTMTIASRNLPAAPLNAYTHIQWDPVNKVLLWPYMSSYDAYIDALYIWHPDTQTWETDISPSTLVTLRNPSTGQRYDQVVAASQEGLPVRGNMAFFDKLNNALLLVGGVADSDSESPNDTHLFLYRYGSGLQTLKGDINQDNKVNILDVQKLVNIILGIDTTTQAADVNSDGFVNVLDVQALVNIILGV